MDTSAPEDRRTWPVFLIGCHRSGTTLARFMLDTHAEIACPPESKFISALYDMIGAPQILPALLSLQLHPAEIMREIGLFARRLLDLSTAKSGKRRWVDKTPNYYRILPFLDAIFGREVLFLFMVRHPLDSVVSLNQNFRFATPQFEDPEIARAIGAYGSGLQCWAHYWRDVYETIGVFAAACPERCHIFRYEDLAQSPDRVLPDLLAFMGEADDPGLPERAFTTAHLEGYEDPKIRQTGALHQNAVGRWKSLGGEQMRSLWPIVGDVARRFGYAAEDAAQTGD